MSNKQEETRLGKLYSTIVKAEEDNKQFVMPKMMTKGDLREYVETMIKDRTPRHLRKEGRKSHLIENYMIPMNYFLVESNSVNYNSSTGSVFLDSPPDENATTDEEILESVNPTISPTGKRQILRNTGPMSTSSTQTIPLYFREHDYGTMIALHIFNHGRKTIDEMVAEITGMEKHLLTILINKMIEDGYLKTYTDVEEKDGEKIELQTLELVDRVNERMLPANETGT